MLKKLLNIEPRRKELKICIALNSAENHLKIVIAIVTQWENIFESVYIARAFFFVEEICATIVIFFFLCIVQKSLHTKRAFSIILIK